MFTLATIILGSVLAIGAVIITVLLRRVVPTNMVHIVQSSKQTTPYGRGKDGGNTYYAFPTWVPKVGISVLELPESIFNVNLKNYEAYDQARLPFTVDVTAFFRIERAEDAAQRVASFSELSSQLHSVLEGSVRRILATNQLEHIMEARATLGQQFTDEVSEQVKQWGVIPVKTVEFMDIKDVTGSLVIHNIMEKEKSRIDMESRVAVASNSREAKLAEIDAQRTIDVQRQDAEQLVGQRTADKEKAVGISMERSRQEIQEEAKITAQKTMAVKSVEENSIAEINKSVAITNAEAKKSTDIIKADAEKQTIQIKAEADKQSTILRADGDKESTKLRAEGTKAATVLAAEGNLATAQNDAIGIKAVGESRASAESLMLMAPVNAQITLAKEIGANAEYQQYLVTIEQISANKEVGIKMADALANADIKIVSSGGSNILGGVSKVTDMFSAEGGVKLAGLVTGLTSTPEGKAVVDKLTGGKSVSKNTGDE